MKLTDFFDPASSADRELIAEILRQYQVAALSRIIIAMGIAFLMIAWAIREIVRDNANAIWLKRMREYFRWRMKR
jgi:hypothetical protein